MEIKFPKVALEQATLLQPGSTVLSLMMCLAGSIATAIRLRLMLNIASNKPTLGLEYGFQISLSCAATNARTF